MNFCSNSPGSLDYFNTCRIDSIQKENFEIWHYKRLVKLRMRSSAASILFSELANENRRYPSPCFPNAVPGRPATPASVSRRSATSRLDRPRAEILGER